MHKKFEINQAKIKGSCQSGKEVVPHDSKSDLPLEPAWSWMSKMYIHFNLAAIIFSLI